MKLKAAGGGENCCHWARLAEAKLLLARLLWNEILWKNSSIGSKVGWEDCYHFKYF